MVYLVHGAHTRREDNRLTFQARMTQKIVIGQRRRGNLVTRNIEPVEEIDRRLVPAGGQPQDASLLAVTVNRFVLFEAELQPELQVAIRVTKRAFARPGQFLRRVYDLDRAVLELH